MDAGFKCTQLIVLLLGMEVHRVQLGARAEQSHVKKNNNKEKNRKNKCLAPAVRSRERCTAAERSQDADA